MKLNHLSLFYCQNCHVTLEYKVISSKQNELIEGFFCCPDCGQWYPVTDGIAFFLEDHYSFAKEFRQMFMKRHRLKLKNPSRFHSDQSIVDKNQQIKFFNEEASKYTEAHTLSPFVRLLDTDLLKFWEPFISNKGLIVNVGCGTGMRTLPLAEIHKQNDFIGIDISLNMIRVASKEARDKKLQNISFVIADAERLPLASEIGETVIGAGILHHVPHPQLVLREAQRILKMNGHYLGIENNRSIFRFLFDLLQKIAPVWHEKAGSHPLMSISELKRWGEDEHLKLNICSRVFLPPQLINSLHEKISRQLFRLSEIVGQSLPFIRMNGGMLFIEGKKI